MNMINEAKNDKYPKGLAHLVAKELQTLCNPKDRMEKVEATNVLRAVKMKKGTKPNKFFNRLKALKVQYQGYITDEMIINEIMVKATQQYKGMLANQSLTKGDSLTIDDLKKAMNEMYRVCSSGGGGKFKNDSSSDDDDSRGEVIGSAFRGKCFNCGQKGHRAVDCPQKKQGSGSGKSSRSHNNNRKFNGIRK